MHSHDKPQKTIWQKLFSGGWWALFTMFIWEIVEEGLESLIAFCISEVIALFIFKAVSTLAIIGATQGVKVCIRRFLTPFVKTLTYKGGHDKMSKIKKTFTWLWCNKKTLIGTASAAVAGLSGANIIPADKLPELIVGGFNITPILYYACLVGLSLLGVFGVGIESITAFFERMGLIKEKKEQKSIEKEARKEIAQEEKRANQTQAELEKEKARAEAQAAATEEREKAEKEHRAKVEEVKARLIAEKNKASN